MHHTIKKIPISGKLNRLLEGETKPFPGNASLTQFFQVGFTENRIQDNRVALIYEEKHHTFKQLDETSAVLAEAIREIIAPMRNGNPDGDTVIGVCIPPSEKLVFILFAILKLGAAYVPFDVSFPEERVVSMVKVRT